MIRCLPFLLLLAVGPLAPAAPTAVTPESVVVLYNSSLDKSQALAQHYAKARDIPADHLVGLDLPTSDEISRADYDDKIRDPLIKVFDEKGWWTREKAASDLVQPITNSVRFLVTMSGVPYKIARTADSIPPEEQKRKQYVASAEGNEASVDSELSLLGVTGYPIKGPLSNPYYEKDDSVMAAAGTAFLIVGRIDGPGFPLCTRLIDDAVAVEKTGLWGMAYLDLAKKGPGYEVGDVWLENIARMNTLLGIPTVVDRNFDTFVTNYPMTEAALYFGWYAHQRNGPLLNPEFHFRRGAVAVHLHSFSASDLRNAQKRWAGPLLHRGAAATLGNVYEPFLQLTHRLDIFYERLVKGYTLGEAAYMSIPSLSWQAVVLGDPLYRPFSAMNLTALEADADRGYKALRTGFARWKDDRETLVTQLRTAAARMESGLLYEALGLLFREEGKRDEAGAFFQAALDQYKDEPDKLRQVLHLVDLDRHAAHKDEAIQKLRAAQSTYANIPEGKAVTALLNILDPPAPPPARIDN